MIDLFIRAGNAGALATACPWLRSEDEGERYWVTSGDGFIFDPIGPVVLQPGSYDDEGEETAPPVMDDGFHGILRAVRSVADLVPADMVVTDREPPRCFAGDPPPDPGEEVENPGDPDAPFDAIAYAADRRWRREVGGTTWRGLPVHTDRESQNKVLAERMAIAIGRRSDPDGWKFADGVFRLVKNEEFISLAEAVRDHVRMSFAIESGITPEMTRAQIDAAFA